MLLIKMYDMCEDCPFADLHLTATTIFAGGEPKKIQWDVKCNHEDACKRMEHKHEEEK